MTTPEHTLVGIHLAFATGMHERYGWPLIAFVGIAANLPDWDGLPMLVDMQSFESGHRVWGHNVFAILLTSLLFAWSQAQFCWIDRIGNGVLRRFPASDTADTIAPPSANRPPIVLGTLAAVAILAQLSHLPCDMVVSGGRGLSDWAIRPFWPLVRDGYVLPLIPWGDIGPTVILMAGIIGVAKFPSRMRTVSKLSLIALVAYLLARGWSRGVIGA